MVDRAQVLIGYEDRFTGIHEVPFNEFKKVHEHEVRCILIDFLCLTSTDSFIVRHTDASYSTLQNQRTASLG
jgi:hypothetical protein